jgi:ElaB/YqjD/DUF883 family membrane-anchored ribosome-binding protein
MAEDPIRKELDALKADIAQLRTDIVDLTTVIKDVASEKVSSTKADAQKRAQGAWEEIERKLNETLDQGRSTVGDIEDKITSHPGGSMLTAFGLGFIIAKLMDMGGRH